MTTYLGKSCSFCLPRVPFVNCRQFMYLVISLLVLRAGYGIWLYQFLIIAYLFTLHNILWLEVPKLRIRKNRRHLKCRTSASAREHYFSLENPLSFNHPPTHFLIFVRSYMNDGHSEGQTNKGIEMLLAAARGISWWHIMFILEQFATKLPGRPHVMTARTGQFYYVDTSQGFWTATVSVRRDGLAAKTIH